jgi:UDP:flavonoid glycosyltransferase YjiC (YdhE family)
MAEILIASLAPIGHVGPLLNVARGLVDRGDRVTVLTASHRAAMIRAVGARPHPLPAAADFDETRLDIDLPAIVRASQEPGENRNTVLFVSDVHSTAAGCEWLADGSDRDAVAADGQRFGESRRRAVA